MSASPTPAPTEDASAHARGRPVASKSLNTPATRSTGSAGASTSATRKPTRTPSAASSSSKASTTSAKAARTAPSVSSRASSKDSESGGGGFKVTKLSSTTVTLPTTWTPRPPQPTTSSASTSQSAVRPPVSSIAEQQPVHTSDPLQVAAQVYPWTYMTSTLDACFNDAEGAAIHDLETRAKELSAEESEIAEQRDRLEAERAIDFFEELGSGAFAKEAPGIMQLFYSHGDSCARVETEALKLAMRNGPDPDDEEPLKVYNDILQVLEKLQHEATSLQYSITKLTETPSSHTTTKATTDTTTEPAVSIITEEKEKDATANTDPNLATATETTAAHSQVTSVFASCLPVLRARIANLTMAQELIDTALENVSLGLRMESMGII